MMRVVQWTTGNVGRRSVRAITMPTPGNHDPPSSGSGLGAISSGHSDGA